MCTRITLRLCAVCVGGKRHTISQYEMSAYLSLVLLCSCYILSLAYTHQMRTNGRWMRKKGGSTHQLTYTPKNDLCSIHCSLFFFYFSILPFFPLLFIYIIFCVSQKLCFDDNTNETDKWMFYSIFQEFFFVVVFFCNLVRMSRKVYSVSFLA